MSDFDSSQISPDLRKTMAKEAKDLLEDRVFLEAIRRLRMQWYGALMTDDLEEHKEKILLAKLRALQAIPLALETILNDQKAALNRGGSLGRV